MMVPVVQRYLSRQDSNDDLPVAAIDKKSADNNSSPDNGTHDRSHAISSQDKQRVLVECVEMYREHPVRSQLRSFILQDITTFMNRSPVRWEKGIEQWESSEDRHTLQSLYRYVRPMTKGRRLDQRMRKKAESLKDMNISNDENEDEDDEEDDSEDFIKA